MESVIRSEAGQEEQVKTAAKPTSASEAATAEQPMLRIVDNSSDESEETQAHDPAPEVTAVAATADVLTAASSKNSREFCWDEDLPLEVNAPALARRLCEAGDIFRASEYPQPTPLQDGKDSRRRWESGSNQTYEDVPVEKITVVLEGRRRVDEARVKELVRSILDTGLLQPIGLAPDYRLLYGAHRLEAYRRLGRSTIPAIIHKLDDLHLELAEIDENIQRANLSVVEQAKALARRKEIYEELHPETMAGKSQAAGANRVLGNNVSDKLSPTFTKDTAAKTGKSPRSIERLTRLGTKLDEQAAKMLAGTQYANNAKRLTHIARLSAEQQRQIAKKIAQGQDTTLEEATGTTVGTSGSPDVKRGLRGVRMVTAALTACGIYQDHEAALLSIKEALDHHGQQQEPQVQDAAGQNSAAK